MPDLVALVALMPFAEQRLVAQTTQVQAVRQTGPTKASRREEQP